MRLSMNPLNLILFILARNTCDSFPFEDKWEMTIKKELNFAFLISFLSLYVFSTLVVIPKNILQKYKTLLLVTFMILY